MLQTGGQWGQGTKKAQGKSRPRGDLPLSLSQTKPRRDEQLRAPSPRRGTECHSRNMEEGPGGTEKIPSESEAGAKLFKGYLS